MTGSDEDRSLPLSLDRPVAVVFDADGVLFDTAGHWREARRTLFIRHGRDFGQAENRETVGTGVDGTGRALSGLLGHPELADDLSDQLFTLLSEHLTAQPPSLLPGALDLVGELRGRMPIGVASNSPRALLALSLDSTGLKTAFDAVVGADEVTETKPAPDLYLAACRRLGAAPQRCVAVEDSPTGTTAARRAGLHVVGLRSFPGCDLDADEIVESLDAPRLRARLGLPSEAPASRNDC